MAGSTCLSFAAAALPSTSRHQDDPSIGPGLTKRRKATGIRGSTAFRRSPDSRASCASLAKVGESSAACCTETGREERCMAAWMRGEGVHFIITDAWVAKSRAVHLSGTKLMLALGALSLALMLTAAGLYHLVFLKGAREGWPV